MNVTAKKKISRKLLLGLSIFALVLFLFTALFVGYYYYNVKMREYRDTSNAYAKVAADFIDGDRVLAYVEPVGTDADGQPVYEKDDYYDTVMAFLNASQSMVDLMRYYYVFVPYEDDLVYVWDANTAEDYAELGYREEYMDGGKEAVERIYRADPEEEITVFEDETYGHIACAYYPILDSEGNPVAVVGVDLSMEGIEQTLFRFILTMVAAIILVTLVAVAIYYFIIRRSLVRPIVELNKATKTLVENLDRHEDFHLAIRTGDELEELAGSFEKMNRDLNAYLEQLKSVTAEKERIGAELSVATRIQADMLPRIFPAFPERREFDLFATMDPAKEVGGDFYDFFFVDEDHLALVMADVSGKGVPAALFMVIAKTLIKNRAQLKESPAQILNEVNDRLCEGNEAGLFVTVWLAIVEISTGKGIAANAGHEHPAIRRAGGVYELEIYKHSPAVAVMEGMRFKEHTFELHPGDQFFVYTDGVTEATNGENELFGNDRLLAALNRHPEAGPEELLPAVRGEIDGFVREAPQFDDITMLGFAYHGPGVQ